MNRAMDWPWLSSSPRVASSPYDPSIPDAVNNPMMSQQTPGAPGGIVVNNLGTDGQAASESLPKSDVTSVDIMEEAPTPSTDYRYKPWKARHRRAEGKVTFSETPTETYDIPLETEGSALTPATIKNVPIAGTVRAPMLQEGVCGQCDGGAASRRRRSWCITLTRRASQRSTSARFASGIGSCRKATPTALPTAATRPATYKGLLKPGGSAGPNALVLADERGPSDVASVRVVFSEMK